jgi:hypothetical protein
MTLAPRSVPALVQMLMALGLGAGCATKMLPPARSSGATLSDEGISVAVVGQRCAEVHPAGASASVSLEATLAVEVGNPTPEPVTVYPEKMMLLVPGPIAPHFSKREDSQAVSISGGTTQPFAVQYVAPGITCTHEMRLDSTTALEWNGRPVVLSAVRFTPTEPQAPGGR